MFAGASARLGDPGYALTEDSPLTIAIAAPKTRDP
jgi:hypothetical protein